MSNPLVRPRGRSGGRHKLEDEPRVTFGLSTTPTKRAWLDAEAKKQGFRWRSELINKWIEDAMEKDNERHKEVDCKVGSVEKKICLP